MSTTHGQRNALQEGVHASRLLNGHGLLAARFGPHDWTEASLSVLRGSGRTRLPDLPSSLCYRTVHGFVA